MDFNFTAEKPPKCANCGKDKGHHRAVTAECPLGAKTSIGYMSYGPKTYVPKKKKTKGAA